MTEVIRSVRNPLIKDLVRLHRAGARRERGLLLAEGRRCLDGLLAGDWHPRHLFVAEDLPVPAGWPTANLRRVSTAVAGRLASSRSPSGYLGCFAQPDPGPLRPAEETLVLVDLADPGNVGTLIRSAAAFGQRQVVCVGGADPFGPKAVQATAGTLAAVTIHRLHGTTDPLDLPHARPRVGLVPSDGDGPDRLPPPPWWILAGSEAHGLPTAWLTTVDHALCLPMRAGVESLNAAVAGSIAAWLAWSWSVRDGRPAAVRGHDDPAGG